MPKDSKREAKLDENQSKWLEPLYRAILNSALDCVIVMDGKGRVREFNPAAERVLGFSHAEAIGQELAELIIPERLREQHRQGLAHYLKTGEGPVLGRRIEINALCKDGSEILVELAITAIRTDGEPLFAAYLRDITERARGEEAYQRLGAIVDSSDDAIVSKDLQGVIKSWNTGAQSLFGYTAEEVIGKPIMILIPKERHNEEPKILERIGRGERVDHYETIRRRKDGALLNISLTVSPIRDNSGKVIGVSKIARDITERVRNERRRLTQYTVASLLASSWTLEDAAPPILQAVASMGDWVLGSLWLFDEAATELRCHSIWHGQDDGLANFARLSRATQFSLGKGLPGRVWESKQPTWIHDVRIDPNFPRTLGAEKSGLRGGFAFPTFAGREINGVIEMFTSQPALPDEDLLKLVDALGIQVGLFIERRRIQVELQRQKENAEAASAAKDRFLAMLSHELRTPLTPVLIWAGGMSADPALSEEVREGLRMISRNIELEARLIDDMLDLTRITRGKLKLKLVTADVHDLLRHALEIVGGEMQDRQVEVSLDLAALQHELRVDAPRLQQVFWNIFRNAYKFTPNGGTITVRSRNPGPDNITIEIDDSGAGIEPQFLEKIFGTFEQVDSAREGLGLGLAISKAIIEMHGGTIRALSEGLGRGATFAIDLPLSRADQKA